MQEDWELKQIQNYKNKKHTDALFSKWRCQKEKQINKNIRMEKTNTIKERMAENQMKVLRQAQSKLEYQKWLN